MKDFRQHFLSESSEKLQKLCAEIKEKEILSDSEKNALFRTLHTFKGTSQTFGLNVSSRLAHELENLLSANEKPENFYEILNEGLKLLDTSFKKKDFEFPEDFAKKLREIAPFENKDSNKLLSKLPQKFLSNLSSQEKNALKNELEKGKNLFCAEIAFEMQKFAGGLKNFCDKLNESSEIIAKFPASNFQENGKIGFQILFASFEDFEKIRAIAEDFSAKIIFSSLPREFSFDVNGIFEQIAEHGKNIAENSGKAVEFVFFSETQEMSAKNLQLIFEMLLHLVRNSVDHAFETSGTVKIALQKKENGLFLKFEDDGRGIDLEKLREKALEKNLIDENFPREATLELIFQSELSTASEITETSGRGVGLDSVKTAIKSANGTIKVESKANKGTIFEIFLPENE